MIAYQVHPPERAIEGRPRRSLNQMPQVLPHAFDNFFCLWLLETDAAPLPAQARPRRCRRNVIAVARR